MAAAVIGRSGQIVDTGDRVQRLVWIYVLKALINNVSRRLKNITNSLLLYIQFHLSGDIKTENRWVAVGATG